MSLELAFNDLLARLVDIVDDSVRENIDARFEDARKIAEHIRLLQLAINVTALSDMHCLYVEEQATLKRKLASERQALASMIREALTQALDFLIDVELEQALDSAVVTAVSHI